MGKRNHNSFQKRDPDPQAKPKYRPLTKEEINRVEDEVHNNQKYGNHGNGKLLEVYFQEKPKNDDYTTVLHKVILIDFTNSTQLGQHKKIFTVYSLAKGIMSIPNLDERIENGDPSVVDAIAELTPINLFSFASKFCFYHNRKMYSIFDGVVIDTLPQYIDVTKTYLKECKDDKKDKKKNETDKKTYKDYRDVIDKLIKVYNLESEPNIRQKVDHFLWFPNKDRNKEKKLQKKIKQSSDLSTNNKD